MYSDYTHRIYINIQTIQFFFSHFIFLTWYQSQCSDFLAPVVFSRVFLLPLHPVPTVKSKLPLLDPQLLQVLDPVLLLIKLQTWTHRLIYQTIPSKTQPESTLSGLTRAPTCHLKVRYRRNMRPYSSTRH